MEPYREPFNEAERIYLRSRLAMPGVLLGFGLIGLIACVFVLVREWPDRAYIFLAVLILDAAATFLLVRIFQKLRTDVREGEKLVVPTTVEQKSSPGPKGPWILVVKGKSYRVNKETYDVYHEGDPLTLMSTPRSGIWLGFGAVQ